MEPPVLRVENLVVEFERRLTRKGFSLRSGTERLRAVNGVSLEIGRGKTLGIVGESGCGKSTLSRAIMRLQAIDAGRIFYGDTEVSAYPAKMPRDLRRRVQMVFQNPYASLNPRQTVYGILSEPLEIHFPQMNAARRRERVAELLDLVGLSPDFSACFPHEFSGGQRQRIAIARALATEAELIVCDEPVSALDVSVQAQIISLLKKIREQLGVAYLFIAHDLAVVGDIADEVLVMHRGEIVERGCPDTVYSQPQHAYTRSLLAAVPAI